MPIQHQDRIPPSSQESRRGEAAGPRAHNDHIKRVAIERAIAVERRGLDDWDDRHEISLMRYLNFSPARCSDALSSSHALPMPALTSPNAA